tara:strand:- start:988 stop:1371 length:384 start_codon:yes stop_codon:yes gene_type:complete
MANPQKSKGDKYEVDLSHYFNDHIYEAKQCSRAPLSGGGKVGLNSGGADLLGTTGIFVEAKRVERLNVREAMAQAEKNIEATHAPEFPVVITRRNREALDDSLCVMRLKHFKELYKAWLQVNGYNYG